MPKIFHITASFDHFDLVLFIKHLLASLIAALVLPVAGSPPAAETKLNHKVELLCFADKTIIQTDSVYFIKISLTIFLHEFWFCQSIFVLYQKTVNSGLHATSNSVKTTFPCYYFCQNWIVFVVFRCYLGLKRLNLQFFRGPSNFLIVSLSLFEKKIKM